MGKLEGKIAVVTGGSSGIGLATAKRFVEEGAHVIITGRRENELKEAAASIARNVTTVVGDVSRLEDLDRLYAQVKETHGQIDILFANAGAGTVAPLAAATELAKRSLGEEGQKAYGAMTPLLRMAEPAEIGAAAAFLASSDSSFMTGSEVAVDGGLAQI